VGAPNGETEALGHSATGVGYLVDLPGYDNDVLTALTLSGGLPGTNAIDEIIVYRNLFRGEQDRALLLRQFQAWQPGCRMPWAAGGEGPIVRIPLRLKPGEDPLVRPEDIVLHEGDVVFVESRPLDRFYVGGLLPPGEHLLPRDYDLHVVEAILRVRGPLVNGAFAQSNLSGFIIPPGLGEPSPSLLSVVRHKPDGCERVIRVDLNRALRDPCENILVQPGDVLILQETPTEAIVRYLEQRFNFTLTRHLVLSRRTNAAIDLTTP
jgi:hypothetical protein